MLWSKHVIQYIGDGTSGKFRPKFRELPPHPKFKTHNPAGSAKFSVYLRESPEPGVSEWDRAVYLLLLV
jgi:hypothetical protein